MARPAIRLMIAGDSEQKTCAFGSLSRPPTKRGARAWMLLFMDYIALNSMVGRPSKVFEVGSDSFACEARH